MYKQLTSEQRYVIYVLLKEGKTYKSIASAIGVSNSTITREIRRNGKQRSSYNWQKAQFVAMKRRYKSVGNRSLSPTIKRHAIQLLVKEQWSPEQISGLLAKDNIRISHESIYKIIREDKRRFGTLYKHCRHRLKHRKRQVGAIRNTISDRISIHQRPIEADGTRFGDFEMDTIVGKNNQDAILTITERKTNMLLMAKLKYGKDSKELAKSAIKLLKPYMSVIKTITTDNGPEFAAHKDITDALKRTVYFADPYSSWQKGSIENINGLIRQYIPKGTSFRYIDDEDVKKICNKINNRPRKKHHFMTPKQCFMNLSS